MSEVSDVFTKIEEQMAAINERNCHPQIVVMYRPLYEGVKSALCLSGICSDYCNHVIGENTIMGLKIILTDYEIDGYVKVY